MYHNFKMSLIYYNSALAIIFIGITPLKRIFKHKLFQNPRITTNVVITKLFMITSLVFFSYLPKWPLTTAYTFKKSFKMQIIELSDALSVCGGQT